MFDGFGLNRGATRELKAVDVPASVGHRSHDTQYRSLDTGRRDQRPTRDPRSKGYIYVGDDPVNLVDPSGLEAAACLLIGSLTVKAEYARSSNSVACSHALPLRIHAELQIDSLYTDGFETIDTVDKRGVGTVGGKLAGACISGETVRVRGYWYAAGISPARRGRIKSREIHC
jgi:hypothetical protein